jgi:hypothetical protein
MLARERRGIGEVANDTLTARQQPAHWTRITDAQAELAAVALGGWEGPTDLVDALRARGVWSFSSDGPHPACAWLARWYGATG